MPRVRLSASVLVGAALASALGCATPSENVQDGVSGVTGGSVATTGVDAAGAGGTTAATPGSGDSSAGSSGTTGAQIMDAGRGDVSSPSDGPPSVDAASTTTGTDPASMDAAPPDEDVDGEAADNVSTDPAEDHGADCPEPERPTPSQLPAVQTLPDPFMASSGARITTAAEWPCRRAEIKAQVEQYETGPKPVVAPEQVSATWADNRLTVTVNEGGRSVSFAVDIQRPASAEDGPSPLLIALWGPIGLSRSPFITLDTGVFSDNGVATTTYNTDAIGAQSGGGSRGRGLFFDLYGSDHPAGSTLAWAWGVSRIIDALEKTPEANIDPERIAVTGCSRWGKGALITGAFDERIALTIPQESGAGGTSSWRVAQAQSAQGENVQTLSNAASEQPWFRPDFGQNFGDANVPRLPFDSHMVIGMVAPRALLALDNHMDWLGIDSSFTGGSAAHEIWTALDRSDAMGYWQTAQHEHCSFPASQRGILDAYVKKFLLGDGSVDTTMLRAEGGAKADLDRWKDWTTPSLR